MATGIYLFELANATFYLITSPTVYDVIYQVICNTMTIYLKVVNLHAKDVFFKMMGISDGAQIRINPPAKYKEDYINR